jgi:hypothetical protein
MEPLTHIIRESSSSFESLALTVAAMLRDLKALTVPKERLHLHQDILYSGAALPQGSVEYLRAAMRLCDIPEPPNISYPDALREFLGREVWQSIKRDLLTFQQPVFVKPQETKLFTGFVCHPQTAPAFLDEYDAEQWTTLCALPEDTPLWFSEPVEFLSECRFYVQNGKILGWARYDQHGAEDAPCAEPAVVQSAVDAWTSQGGCPAVFSLDFGVCPNGKTLLIDANDGWALGLYGQALSPTQYLDFLACRWSELLLQARAHQVI